MRTGGNNSSLTCLWVAAGLAITATPPVAIADAPAGYYDSAAGLTGDDLRDALHEIINDQVPLTYSDTRDALMDLDEDPANPDNVILIYSNVSVPKGTWPDFNREHSWPQSLGTGFGPMRTDLHHMFPCDEGVNSFRSNLYFDDCESGCNSHAEAPEAYKDDDSFEPPDYHKGDIARAMFYMDVRYAETIGDEVDLVLGDVPTESDCNCMARRTTLLEWHVLDPVDDRERARNDGVYALQGNRNPFVDHPGWVSQVWGSKTTSEIFVPAAAHAFGTAGTIWRTDLQIRANGGEAAEFTIALLEEGSWNRDPEEYSFTLPAGQSLRTEDVLDSVFGYQGSAALMISVAAGDILVTSRTYNDQPAGTFGQFIPSVSGEAALRQNQVGAMIQLTENADYRTNVGLVNASAESVFVNLLFFDGDGTYFGDDRYYLGPYEYEQINRPFATYRGGSLVDDGYLQVTSDDEGARFFAYASVVDNRTGDAIYIPAVAVPADVVAPCIPSWRCCKICTTGRACGDTCISIGNSCSVPKGCACNDWEVCE